jgi:hypothetical protein
MEGSFEEDDEPSAYRKYWDFFQWLSNCWLLTRNLDSLVLVIILVGLKLTGLKVWEQEILGPE